MKARSRKGWNIAFGVLLVILFVFLMLMGQKMPTDRDLPSARSYEPEGRRAAFLLLQRFDLQPITWMQPPASLPSHGATLLLARPPRSPFGREDGEVVPRSPLMSERDGSSLNEHLARHYRRFLDSGGVILASAEEDMLEFLSSELEIETAGELATFTIDAESRDERSKTVLASGEEMQVDWDTQFTEAALEDWFVWARSEDSGPVAVSLEVGAGELVLLAGGDVLSNDALREGDEGLFLLRTLDEYDRSGTVLFDDYALGLWTPESAGAFALSGAFLQPVLQFLMLVLVFVWRLGWVGRFARDPEPIELLSPLMRVQAQARLIERAGRHDLLASWLRRGFVTRIRSFWRMKPRRAGEQDDEVVLEQIMEALAKRACVDSQAWKDSLSIQRVSNARSLEQYESSLEEYERALTGND